MLEQLIDRAAKEIGMDPIQLRLKNLKKVGDPDNKGLPMETCPLEKLIKLGAEKIGWARYLEEINARPSLVSGPAPLALRERPGKDNHSP